MSAQQTKLEAQLRKVRELESNLTFRFSITNKLLEQQTLKLVSDTPLNLTGYRILRITSIFEEITISELSRQMHVDRALISRAANALVNQGYLGFFDAPNNKRKKLLRLTAEGAVLIGSLNERFRKRRAALEQAIGQEALNGLWQAMEQIAEIDLGET